MGWRRGEKRHSPAALDDQAQSRIWTGSRRRAEVEFRFVGGGCAQGLKGGRQGEGGGLEGISKGCSSASALIFVCVAGHMQKEPCQGKSVITMATSRVEWCRVVYSLAKLGKQLDVSTRFCGWRPSPPGKGSGVASRSGPSPVRLKPPPRRLSL